MDGFARPGGQAGQRPAQQSRPMPPQGRPQPRPASSQTGQRMADPRMASANYGRPQYQPPSRQQMAATQGYEEQRPAKSKAGRSQRKTPRPVVVVVQFILGVGVIGVVALAIVWLYVRYYQ